MIFEVKKGNLFDLDKKYTLVHCISQDCKMGAGIAKDFDKKFKGMKTYLQYVTYRCNIKYPNAILFCNKQDVINMITKKHYYNKPTYKSFIKSLENVKEICLKENIKYLGIPKLGCGLDRLQWAKVEQIIKDTFLDTDIEIQVRYL